MTECKQSTAYTLKVWMPDATDRTVGKTGLTLTINACKNGASSHSSISPTQTDTGNGWYDLLLTTSHTDTLGEMSFWVTGTGADSQPFKIKIVAEESGKLSSATIQEIWDALTSSLTTSGSIGKWILDKLNVVLGDVKSKTDNLPSDPADASDIASLIGGISVDLTPVQTVVDDIKEAVINPDTQLKVREQIESLASDESDFENDVYGYFTELSEKIDEKSPDRPFKKNTALPGFPFSMVKENGDPATGKTVTVKRILDGGELEDGDNSPEEKGLGGYVYDFTADDRNADVAMYIFSAPGCKTIFLTVTSE